MIHVLAIDPGKNAGAALFLNGVLVASWQVKPGGEWAVVAEAIVRAEGEPIIAVAERWSNHGAFGGSRTQRGLGEAYGRWTGALHHEGIKRVVKVYARTWQSMISGRVLPRAEMLVLTKRVATTIAHREVGEDEAVAIVLGTYATTRGLHHVHAMLSIAEGKRLGIDVTAARERVKAEKVLKRQRKARKVARS